MMRMCFRLHCPIAVIFLVGALLVASCSASPTPAATSKISPTAVKPYGSLTIGADLGLAEIDPARTNVNTFTYMSNAVFDTLVYYDAADKLLPGIAERWEISPDGKTHILYIRKGVKFQNGDNLTGEDVKFSIDRMLSSESVHSDAPSWRKAVASVELKDEYTVALRLKLAAFELLLSSDNGMGAVMPKKYIEEKGVDYFQKHPVASGPWKVVRYEPGNRLELEAVDDHWRTVPKIKNLTLLHVSEEATKVAMLKTGELDLAQVTPESVRGLKSAGLRIMHRSSGAQYFATLFYDPENPGKYAFGNIRVREALQLAVNSKEIGDEILGGFGEPYTLYGEDPTADFWDPNLLAPNRYDPERAKKLLAEAGYPNGFDTTLYDIGGGGILSTLNMAISGYWQKVGVNSKVVPIERSAHRPLFQPKAVPEVWNTVYVGLGSPKRGFNGMAISYHSKASVWHNLINPRLDELIDKVPATADARERKKLALEATVMAKNEHTVVTIVTAPLVVALGPKVGDLSLFTSPGVSSLTYETITRAK